jgi:hypothetical protein
MSWWPAVVPPSHSTKGAYLRDVYGSEGLEPATSGVIGRVGHNDARWRTPLNALICRRFSFRG